MNSELIDNLGWKVAFGLVVVWCISALVRYLRGRWALHVHHERGRTARAGEASAEELLIDYGCEVIGQQVQGFWDVLVDGEPVEVEVFADYIVEIDGERWVAEVKTGERAPSIKTAGTRRQLLEYLFVFDAAGLLLVDMETRTVHCVEFLVE